MSSIQIPTELMEKLNQLHDALLETSEPLENTSQGKEILALVDDVKGTIGRELAIFSKTIGARRYHARIFTYTPEKKGKRTRWRTSDIQLAEPEYVAGGPEHLRALLRGCMEAEGNGSLSLWVNPMPTPEGDAFFVFVMHPEGREAAFIAHGGQWSSARSGSAALEMTLGVMLRPKKSSKERWATLIEAQVNVMRIELRADVDAFMSKNGAQPLTDEAWDDFIATVFRSKENLQLLQEMMRASGMPVLHEAQRLLRAMVELVENAMESHQERLANMEKTHARALKRFKTDLDKHKSARDVASNRSRQLEREMQALRKQLLGANAGQTQPTNQNSIGLALDRFFV